MGIEGSRSWRDGRFSVIWWWSLGIGLAGGPVNCRNAARGVFVIGGHEGALSIFAVVVLFLTVPLVLLAARFPRVGGRGLVIITILAMAACIPFVKTGVSGLLLGWLMGYVSTLLSGLGFWLSWLRASSRMRGAVPVAESR